MTPQQILQIMQSNGNPVAAMQALYGNNPLMQRAMQMANGKNDDELRQIVRNLAQQRGISEQQLQTFAQAFGIKL